MYNVTTLPSHLATLRNIDMTHLLSQLQEVILMDIPTHTPIWAYLLSTVGIILVGMPHLAYHDHTRNCKRSATQKDSGTDSRVTHGFKLLPVMPSQDDVSAHRRPAAQALQQTGDARQPVALRVGPRKTLPGCLFR